LADSGAEAAKGYDLIVIAMHDHNWHLESSVKSVCEKATMPS
jgi:hypothetical protein